MSESSEGEGEGEDDKLSDKEVVVDDDEDVVVAGIEVAEPAGDEREVVLWLVKLEGGAPEELDDPLSSSSPPPPSEWLLESTSKSRLKLPASKCCSMSESASGSGRVTANAHIKDSESSTSCVMSNASIGLVLEDYKDG